MAAVDNFDPGKQRDGERLPSRRPSLAFAALYAERKGIVSNGSKRRLTVLRVSPRARRVTLEHLAWHPAMGGEFLLGMNRLSPLLSSDGLNVRFPTIQRNERQ